MTKEEQIAELMEIIQSMMKFYQKLAEPDVPLRLVWDAETVKKRPPRTCFFPQG